MTNISTSSATLITDSISPDTEHAKESSAKDSFQEALTTQSGELTPDAFIAWMANSPHLRSSMRSYLLGEEFLKLPDVFWKFHTTMSRLTEITHKHIETLNARLDELERYAEELGTKYAELGTNQTKIINRLDQLDNRVDQLVNRVDQLDNRVDQLVNRVDQLVNRVDQLETNQTKIINRLDQLETLYDRIILRMDKFDGRLGTLEGERYERKAAKAARGLVAVQLGFKKMRVVYATGRNTNPDWLPDVLEEACDAGDITDEESYAVERTDLILKGNSGWVLAEVSKTIHSGDVIRAQNRARWLGRAVQETTTPAVIGETISDETSQLANKYNVGVIIFKHSK